MNININYDSSVSSAPAGFKAAVQAAVKYIDSVISSPITVTISFGWGEVDGQKLDSNAVGESTSQGDIYTYAQVRSALSNAASSTDDFTSVAALPGVDPTNGAQFFIATAEEKALGLMPANTNLTDGWVGLSSGVSFTFDPNNRSVPGEYDAVGILEHEITEDLGRSSGIGSTLTNNAHYVTALDLFRYTGPGHLAPTAASGAYFSVDGQHMLYAFNDPSNGGDSGDWADSVHADAFTEAAPTGSVLGISSTDLRTLDVLGYTLSTNQVSVLHAPLDFNGDGLSDILWMNASAGQISEWWASGQAFNQSAFLSSAASGWGVAGVGDFSGDGKADLIWFNPSTSAVSEWQSTGAGFSQNTYYAAVPSGWRVAGVGDFNGDGKSDLVWFNSATHGVSEWQSTGSGFTQNTFYTSVPSGWTIAGVGDFSGDGKGDLLWFNRSTNAISEWQSTGSGFQQNTFYTNVPSGWSVAGVGDFNGDGKSDIVWFNSATSAVSEWQSTGSGFTQNTFYATVPAGWAVAGVGDFNGDGKADILWFNSQSHAVSEWQSTGSGFNETFYSNVPSGWTPFNPLHSGLYMF